MTTLTPAQQVMARWMTEADLLRAVLDACDTLHVRVHHETDSRRSRAGLLDVIAAGPGGLLFAELKSSTGKLRPEQKVWLADLAVIEESSGGVVRARVWRPTDWLSGLVLDELRTLTRRPRNHPVTCPRCGMPCTHPEEITHG